MKPLAYVSDEMYVALPAMRGRIGIEETGEVTVLRSSPRGSILRRLAAAGPISRHADAKRVTSDRRSSSADLRGSEPYQFRLLLGSGIVGYMWPKWVRAGEQAEFRVHAGGAVSAHSVALRIAEEMVRMLGWVR